MTGVAGSQEKSGPTERRRMSHQILLSFFSLFRCSQTDKTFGEMSIFWKNGSKQGFVKLGCKDLEFGTLEPQNCVNLLRDPCHVSC